MKKYLGLTLTLLGLSSCGVKSAMRPPALLELPSLPGHSELGTSSEHRPLPQEDLDPSSTPQDQPSHKKKQTFTHNKEP